MLLLVAGASVLIVIGAIVKEKDAKNILLDVGIAMALGAVIEVLVFSMNPKWFGPKSRNPDEE